MAIRGSPKVARAGVEVEGEKSGFAAVERVTSDLVSADVIIVMTGGNAQAAAARSLAPLQQKRSDDPADPGQYRGSLTVRQALNDAGCRADVDVAEMDNCSYSCWRLDRGLEKPGLNQQLAARQAPVRELVTDQIMPANPAASVGGLRRGWHRVIAGTRSI